MYFIYNVLDIIRSSVNLHLHETDMEDYTKEKYCYNGIKESLQFPRDKNFINANDTTYSRYKLQ